MYNVYFLLSTNNKLITFRSKSEKKMYITAEAIAFLSVDESDIKPEGIYFIYNHRPLNEDRVKQVSSNCIMR